MTKSTPYETQVPRQTPRVTATEPLAPTQAPIFAVNLTQITTMATQMDAYSGSKMPNNEEGAIAKLIYAALSVNMPSTNTETSMDEEQSIDIIDVTITNDADVTTDASGVITINNADDAVPHVTKTQTHDADAQLTSATSVLKKTSPQGGHGTATLRV